MEDEKTDEQKPCGSRDLEKEEGGDDSRKRRKRSRSRSRSSEYSYSSAGSARAQRPPAPVAIHEGTRKMQVTKRKPPRRTGRVKKRRRPNRVRRKPRPKPVQRALSMASVSSDHSGCSAVREMSCKYCGHRCCLRRSEYKKRRVDTQREKRRFTNNLQERRYSRSRSYERRYSRSRSYKRRRSKSPGRRVKKRRTELDKRVEKVERQLGKSQPESRQLEDVAASAQAGPPCPMLSKLFVASNSEPEPNPPEERQTYTQVTPEMIYESLRVLTMWRDGVPTETIYNHIRKNYPVNPDPKEVMPELLEKLRVASITGIVWAVSDDHWRLATELETTSKLDKTHVTLFWRAYGDTMKPLDRNLQPSWKLDREDQQVGTDEDAENVDYNDPDAII